MDRETILKSKICLENDNEFNQKWFTFKKSTFISHIDTLYFLISFDFDWSKSSIKDEFIKTLKETKAQAETSREAQPIFQKLASGLEVRPFFGAQMYSYHFGLADNFDFFVAESLPNVKTPPIMVQLRAQSLWLNGYKKTFDVACSTIEKILKSFDIEIDSVHENRIDYAFHTNYIQDMLNFFPDKHLKAMQISNFMRWHKEGYFYDDDIFADYFTLGRRKSNNVFFRVYNKTKEVIEMGYKQFFIPIWFDNGLISKFDEFVIRKAFVSGSYESKDKARCEFYCAYGKDKEIIEEITDKLNNPDTPMLWYKKRSKGLVPDITIVSNVEFQTKRKFYVRLKKPSITADDTYRKNLYNLFEQFNELIRFITHDTIRFVKYKGKYKDSDRGERPYADWWKRLRSSKMIEFKDEWCVDYYREYQSKLDIERNRLLSVNKMARMSACMKYDNRASDEDDTPYDVDISEFVSSLNDNDIQKYYKVRDNHLKDLRKRCKLEYEQREK